MGRRLAALSHEQMNLNAEMGTRMTERFNVGGALLVKLFGNLEREDSEYAARAARVRDIGIKIAMNRTILFVALTLIASLATAMVYGFGGLMAIDGSLTVGTLIAGTAGAAHHRRNGHAQRARQRGRGQAAALGLRQRAQHNEVGIADAVQGAQRVVEQALQAGVGQARAQAEVEGLRVHGASSSCHSARSAASSLR